MTLRIAICEDNPTQQKNLSRMLQNWQQYSNHNIQICLYNDCESFWFAWTEQMSFDILLLDIDLGQDKMTGMALAKQIRQKDPNVTIIFITALLEYISQGYDVQAFHFLIKPIEEMKLYEVLNRAITISKPKENYLLLENESGAQLIPHSKILYAEAFSHTIALYLQEGSELTCLYFRMSMTELEKQLPSSVFYRCHRSYLVHLNHIQKIQKGEVLLDCNKILPVSRSKEKNLYETFLNYHRQVVQTF